MPGLDYVSALMPLLPVRFANPWPLWPYDASVVAARHTHVVVTALLDPGVVSPLGWYVDSRRAGPIFHRWERPWEPRASATMAALAAIYGLLSRGEVLLHCRVADHRASDVHLSEPTPPLPIDPGGETIESLVREQLAGRGPLPVGVVLTGLHPPGVAVRAWLRRYDSDVTQHRFESHEQTLAALRLAALFIELEADAPGCETDDGTFDLEDVLPEIELACFEHMQARSVR